MELVGVKIEEGEAMLLKGILRKNSLKLLYNGYDFACSYISIVSTKWVCSFAHRRIPFAKQD